MYVKQIAVVSTNPTFVRFFSLECQLLNYKVQHFSKMPSTLETFAYVFLDVDTVRHYVMDRSKIVTVSKASVPKGVSANLLWPVSLHEIRQILEQSPLSDFDDSAHTVDDATLLIENRARRELRYGTQYALLSQSEFLLFEALASAQKKPVSREVLMGLLGAEKGNIADVYVCLLRKKLEQLCDRRVIVTVRGVGYRLMLDVKETENE